MRTTKNLAVNLDGIQCGEQSGQYLLASPNTMPKSRAAACAEWVRNTFGRRWENYFWKSLHIDERPEDLATSLVVIQKTDWEPIGFACWDVSGLGTFGPIGIDPKYQGKGIGRQLTLDAFHMMKKQGYAYAIIWKAGAGPKQFYQKVCRCTEC